MKKIITAIDNSEINKLLKKEKDIKIISKDILYKEGILEQIEKNKDVDLIIIDERIDGEISLNLLIKKIKEKIKNIEIIIITDNKNKIINEIQRFRKIKIYETNKIKIKKILELINLKKEIVQEKTICKNNIISISGASGVGKTITAILLSTEIFNFKTLLIDFNLKYSQNILSIFNIKNKNMIQKINKDLDVISTNKISKIKNILNKNNYNNIIIDLGNKIKKEEKEFILNKSDKNIILLEPNLIGLEKFKNILKEYIEILKIKKNKIFILINKSNKYSINKKIIENIFKKIKIIGEIKNNSKYEMLINNKMKNSNIILDKKEEKNLIKILQ